MKRFLVFRYDAYYPSGGSAEVRGDFDTIEEARAFGDGGYDTFEILDCQEREWVE